MIPIPMEKRVQLKKPSVGEQMAFLMGLKPIQQATKETSPGRSVSHVFCSRFINRL